MAKIQITISAENAQAIAALKQVADAATKTGETVKGAGSSGGFSELVSQGKQVISILQQIASVVTGLSSRMDAAGHSGATAMDAATHAAAEVEKEMRDAAGAAQKAGAEMSAAGKKGKDGLDSTAAAADKTKKKVKDIGDSGKGSFDSATKSTGGFLDKLSKVTIVGAGIVALLREIKDTAVAVLGPGFNFNKTMEQNQLGMAGILQSMTLINGKAVDFSQAMSISSDMMKKLQQDAMRTAASTEDLVEVFRAILAPGINAGMTLDQIRQIAVVGTNAVKSLGVPHQQIVQEMRDLVQGGITASGSTLATALGLTDADIERAKNSSDGLFKFLMDRMKGFEETTKKFPDTMQGRMDQLEEVFTQGGAKFVSKFENPIKNGLSAISDAIGEVDDKTGEIHLNPAFESAAEEVNSALTEMKSLASDIAPSFSWVKDDVLPGLKDTWQALKNISSVLGDSLRMNLQGALPLLEFFGQGFRDLAHDVAEVTGMLKELYDWMAKKSGAKSAGSPQGIADFRQREDTNVLPAVAASSGTDNITSKFPDAKKAIENSQAALKIAIALIETNAKNAVTEIKREQESIEVLYKQSMISAEEYARRKAELDMKIQQAAVTEARQKLEATQGTQYEKDNEKKVAVDKANNELTVESNKLKNFGASLDDVNKAIGAMTGASDAWRKEVENVNIDGLQDNAKAAINSLAAFFQQQTGQQMVVSSGLRDWGGHVSGTKFDVVDAGDSRLLEDNVNGIREKIIDYAKSIGLQVLDEYANPSEHATAGHLDFNAKDFTATFAAQAKDRIGQVYEKSGLDYLNEILALMNEADEIAKSLAESRGDVSSRQKAELTAKYNDLAKKFQTNGMIDAVKNVQELQKAEFLKLDFSQAQKNLEIANGALATSQEDLMNQFAAGSKTAAQVTDEYASDYRARTDKIIVELQRIAKEAGEGTELSNSAKALLRQIVASINDFADKVIQRIDAELQSQISMINIDRNLTSRQKQDKIDDVTRQAAAKKAAEYEQQARDLREFDAIKGNNKNADKIIDLERSAAYYRELSKLPSLLDKVREAGKQAFEDGLLDFFERGILECRNLGDAFRNLAISVLQSIQKVYSEALTKNIMRALFGDSGAPSGKPMPAFPSYSGILQPFKFAEGGSTMDSGLVKGPGTSTSDSILAWMQNIRKWIRVGNGEFIMRGAAVAKYGRDLLERLNSGQVPVGMLQRYAVGGSLTNGSTTAIPGPQDITANLSNSTTVPVTVVNVKDPDEIPRYLKSRDGGKVILNIAKDNATIMRRILEFRG